MGMKIRYNLTMDDVIIFNEYFYEKSETIRKTIRKYRWKLAASPLIGVFALIYFKNIPFTPAIIISAIIVVILSIPIYFLYPNYFKKRGLKYTKNLYKEGANKAILGERELLIQNEGIIEKTQYSEIPQKWESVEKIASYKNQTFIFIGAAQAYIIPQHSILEGDYDAFVADLNKTYNEKNEAGG
jgi:hypothetical protein